MSKFQQMKRKTATSTSTSSTSSSSSKSSSKSPPTLASLLTETRFPLYPLPSFTSTKRRWNVDLSTTNSSLTTITNGNGVALTSSSIHARDLVQPPGFSIGAGEWTSSGSGGSGSGEGGEVSQSASAMAARKAELVHQSAMAVATAPGKQLLMTGFMLWMSGNSLQIFSIMMLCMAFWTPLQKIMSVQSEFARYDGSQVDLLMPKLVFVACNAAGVALALYKSQTLGLLPTSPADWLSTAVRPPLEFSGGSFAL